MMRVAAHHSEQQLPQLADQEPRADLAKRLRTITLAQRGYTAPEIATCTGFSRRAVQNWVARYNREGLAGLATKAGRGRKPPLTPEEMEAFQRRLDAESAWRAACLDPAVIQTVCHAPYAETRR